MAATVRVRNGKLAVDLSARLAGSKKAQVASMMRFASSGDHPHGHHSTREEHLPHAGD
jgi:hypothetical protein